jgi:hypothetical protein
MLIDIITDIEAENGRLVGPSRDLAISRINFAAREIHESVDLEESLDEEIVSFNQENAQTIALPAYMEKVRGARFVDGRIPISIDDMRNRYNFSWWSENETWYLKPRSRGKSPLSRSIDNQSVIEFSVPVLEPVEFSITITGKTDRAQRFQETVTFTPADLVKVSIGNYLSVESVSKSIITQSDVTLKDVEDNTLGQILNSEYQSEYRIYQILDEEQGAILPTNFSGTEILFKKKFQPFKNDADTFLGTSRYDKAIFWKYFEHRTKNPKESAAFLFKCNQVLSQILNNDAGGVRRRINFKSQPFYRLPYNTPRAEQGY